MMTRWPQLPGLGGRWAVWAPSSPAPSLYPARMGRGLAALAALGFDVEALPSCASSFDEGTLSPAALAAELHDALSDEHIDGVIAAVGGWTTLAVLPHLDLDLIAAQAKPIVGYSDVTSLLNLVTARTGLVTFHGPMILSEFGEWGGPWEYTRDSFLATCAAVPAEPRWLEWIVPPAPAWSDEVLWWDREDNRPRAARTDGEEPRVLRPGIGQGPLSGGSLISLGLLAGTKFWPRLVEPVVFLEAESIAPDELLSRVLHLASAGLFDDAVAVLIGKVGSPRATASGYDDFDATLLKALPAHLPVAAGFDIGHTEPMVTLPIGGAARLICPDGGPPALTLLR